eukprot:jgi/Botrbrau1/15801/Bobra.4_1s0151.1
MGLFRYLGRLICKAAFRLTDDNKNGKLESIEIEIAVLRLYHIINKRLPGWQDPPSRAAIIAALKQFDANHDGSLDLDEFELFARSFIKSGPDVFFSRIGKNVVVETGLVPASAMVIKHVARGSALFGGLAQVQSPKGVPAPRFTTTSPLLSQPTVPLFTTAWPSWPSIHSKGPFLS